MDIDPIELRTFYQLVHFIFRWSLFGLAQRPTAFHVKAGPREAPFAGLTSPLGRRRLNTGHGNHVIDIVSTAASRKIVRRFVQPLKDRSNRLGAAREVK